MSADPVVKVATAMGAKPALRWPRRALIGGVLGGVLGAVGTALVWVIVWKVIR
jgi:tetrahydromethanopterin S-methyltransferase subunit D